MDDFEIRSVSCKIIGGGRLGEGGKVLGSEGGGCG